MPYAQIGTNYYGLSSDKQGDYLSQISEADLNARLGEGGVDAARKAGDITAINPSQVKLNPNGFINLGMNATSHFQVSPTGDGMRTLPGFNLANIGQGASGAPMDTTTANGNSTLDLASRTRMTDAQGNQTQYAPGTAPDINANAPSQSKFETGFNNVMANGGVSGGYKDPNAGGGIYTPSQATNGNNAYYKDAQGNVFRASDNAHVTMGNSDSSLDWNKLGLNVAHLNTKEAIASGGKGLPGGLSAADAKGIIDKNVPQDNTNYQADAVVNANQAHQQYLSDYAAYQSSQNQQQTLTQQYTQLSQQMGLPALDTQLLNMKNVMDGSEDDIRNEVTKAGGFATNSQVLALTNARNKTMIQNYNNLLDTRNNMQNNLTTMIGLAEKDRAYASAQIDKQLNFDQQNIQYADKMLSNAQDSLTNSSKTMGWSGVLQAAQATGDPQAIARINSTMGNGFDITIAAQKETEAKAKADLLTSLDLQQKQQNLTKGTAEIAKLNAEASQIRAQNQGNNFSSSGGLPQVNMTANNTPSKVGQLSYLNSLPGGVTGDLATLVKGIANYQINPSSVPTRNYRGVGGLTQSQVLTLVAQYDPSFSQSDYANRQAIVKAFTSGKYSQNINSLNTAVGHISDILSNTQGLNNSGFTPYNAAKNTITNLFGSGSIARAGLNIAAATSELATVFKGTGATDQEIKSLGSINANSSPSQVKAYVETATQLLSSRLQALDDTYTQGMGKAPDQSFLSTTSQKNLLDLQSKGFNIQVPELLKSPLVKLQTFYSVDSQHAQLLQDLGKANPTLANDPQAMIDYLAQQGIEL